MDPLSRQIILVYKSMLPGQPSKKSELKFRIFTEGFEAVTRATIHLKASTRAFQNGGYAAFFSISVSCSVCIPGYQRTKVSRS